MGFYATTMLTIEIGDPAQVAAAYDKVENRFDNEWEVYTDDDTVCASAVDARNLAEDEVESLAQEIADLMNVPVRIYYSSEYDDPDVRPYYVGPGAAERNVKLRLDEALDKLTALARHDQDTLHAVIQNDERLSNRQKRLLTEFLLHTPQ